MPVTRHLLAAALLATATLAHGEIRTEPEVQPGADAPELEAHRVAPAEVASTRLHAFVVPKDDVELPGRPPKIGHAREVAPLAAPGAARRSLAWESTPDGR